MNNNEENLELNDEVIIPKMDFMKLLGEIKSFFEKATSEADQNFVGFYSNLLYFFESKAVEEDFCLRSDKHLNTNLVQPIPLELRKHIINGTYLRVWGETQITLSM